MSNRSLLIAFTILLSVLLIGKLLRGKNAGSYDPQITAVDTAKVDRLHFISGGTVKEEFELVRSGDGWTAVKGGMKVDVPSSSVQSVLSPLVSLNAQRLVTEDKARYEELEITGELAGRMTAYQGKKIMADLLLGGFRFDQMSRTASSFVRKADKPDVYMIDGFAGMGLKARFDQFRDKKLVHVQAEDLVSLDWTGPSGRKQVIIRTDGAWHYAGMEAVDSTAFEGYLRGLVNAQGHAFSDRTSAEDLPVAEKLTLYGNNMLEPTVITAYQQQDTVAPFLIHSTSNREAFFTSDSLGLYKRIFADLRPFWSDGQ